MKKEALVKLVVGVTLVAVLAMALPLSGCAQPSPSPTPTPSTPSPSPSPTPTPSPSPAPTEEIYHWRIQTVHAAGDAAGIIRPWLDDLEEALGGRATFELFSCGELMPDDQLIPAVQAGTLDFVHGSGGCVAAPVDVIDIDTWPPFAWNSAIELMTLLEKEGLGELFVEAYEELGGIKHLGFATTDPVHLLSTRPIEKYEDLDGLKINAPDCIGRIFAEAGTASVFLPPEEFYLSGQTGVLDALAWCGATEAYYNSWYEPFPYFLGNPICGACLTWLVVNEDLWNSLPSDMQEILKMSMETRAKRNLLHYYSGEPRYREYFTVTMLPSEDWARLRTIQWGYLDEIAETSPRCAQAVAIIKDYNAHVEATRWYR